MQLLQEIRHGRATFSLIFINTLVFLYCYLAIGTFDSPEWDFGLLEIGASFGPYLLDNQWYRILTHMFMHGSVFHLLINMYALYSVGTSIEPLIGCKKYLAVYFLCGVASVFSSVYFGMFSIGVGASGAIFGLFGFVLVISIFINRQSSLPITPIVINFVLFLGINIAIAKSLNADTPAHLGGLACGLLLGVSTILLSKRFSDLRAEYVVLPLLVIVYFIMPRFQVTYFNFFQKLLELEKREEIQVAQNLTDLEYYEHFKSNVLAWDTVRSMLDEIPFLPVELHEDTFKLRRYITLQRLENEFRCNIIEKESYIYFDSINWTMDSAQSLIPLNYNLNYKIDPPDTTTPAPQREMTRVFYDKDWVEIEGSIGFPEYYRIGYRDSVGRWQGRVTDFYKSGVVQMKGMYTDDKRDGVFIYYSDHETYESAGRYEDDRAVGKWESFHNNGRLRAEEYYRDRYYLGNLWDSTGVQTVKNGFGTETEYYSTGGIKYSGEYRDGRREGYWYGLFENGDKQFEENYYHGMLNKGRSRDKEGKTYVYDASSLYPLPKGGNVKYNEYLKREAAKVPTAHGPDVVRLSFRVTKDGRLTDFKVENDASPELGLLAKEIVSRGPQWVPARDHGYEAVDGFAFIDVEFGN